MTAIQTDSLIIGAGLVGSLTARTLAEQGESGILLEQSRDAGGVNGSFQDSMGNWFDHGRHIIDFDRSDFTRDFVLEVLKGKVHRFNLERSIVVKGNVIPSAVEIDQWPELLRNKIKLDTSVPIKLGSTREEFALAFGQWFADVVFDEMLQAYPSLRWQLQHGTPEEHLLRWIFPWFFPRSEVEVLPNPGSEINVYSEESRLYHYQRRHSNPPSEEVMYPSQEGFGRLITEMLNDSSEQFELHLGVEDIVIDIDPTSLFVKCVHAGGVDYVARHVFWCAPLPVLCRYLGWQLPEGEPQWELLGSFTFRDPVNLLDHEVLFADPDYRIRRINNPGKIAGQELSRTLQVEYTTLGSEAKVADDEWRASWLNNLHELGFVVDTNPLQEFDFRKVSRGIVSSENLEQFLDDCKTRITAANTNLVTPHLAVGADNNCRLIPQVHNHINDMLTAR